MYLYNNSNCSATAGIVFSLSVIFQYFNGKKVCFPNPKSFFKFLLWLKEDFTDLPLDKKLIGSKLATTIIFHHGRFNKNYSTRS